jgi:hypothetical protein
VDPKTKTENMRTTQPRSLPFLCLLVSLLLLAGCGKPKIIGKWMPLNDLGHTKPIEFFADGKCIDYNLNSEANYKLSGDKLELKSVPFRANDKIESRILAVKFIDDDHLELEGGVRYERVK